MRSGVAAFPACLIQRLNSGEETTLVFEFALAEVFANVHEAARLPARRLSTPRPSNTPAHFTFTEVVGGGGQCVGHEARAAGEAKVAGGGGVDPPPPPARRGCGWGDV